MPPKPKLTDLYTMFLTGEYTTKQLQSYARNAYTYNEINNYITKRLAKRRKGEFHNEELDEN